MLPGSQATGVVADGAELAEVLTDGVVAVVAGDVAAVVCGAGAAAPVPLGHAIQATTTTSTTARAITTARRRQYTPDGSEPFGWSTVLMPSG
jgi:sugar (pentulose or hexulose) kinase